MALDGAAQADKMPTEDFVIHVFHEGQQILHFTEEIDVTEGTIGEVIQEILEEHEDIPAVMRNNPTGCRLFLCANGDSTLLNASDETEILGGVEGTLQLMDFTSASQETPNNLQAFAVHPK